jgi:hypothetical protein
MKNNDEKRLAFRSSEPFLAASILIELAERSVICCPCRNCVLTRIPLQTKPNKRDDPGSAYKDGVPVYSSSLIVSGDTTGGSFSGAGFGSAPSR